MSGLSAQTRENSASRVCPAFSDLSLVLAGTGKVLSWLSACCLSSSRKDWWAVQGQSTCYVLLFSEG